MQEFRTPDQNNAGTEPDPLCNKHTGYNSHKETTSKLTKLHKPDKLSQPHVFLQRKPDKIHEKEAHTHTHTHTHKSHGYD